MMAKRYRGTSTGKGWLWLQMGLVLVMGLGVVSCTTDEGKAMPAPTETPEVQQIPIADELKEEQEVQAPASPHAKLDSSLNQLLDTYRRIGPAGVEAFAVASGIAIDGDRVSVVIETSEDAVDDVTAAVESTGGEVQGYYEGLVEALVPIDALDTLADRDDVLIIRLPQMAVPMSP